MNGTEWQEFVKMIENPLDLVSRQDIADAKEKHIFSTGIAIPDSRRITIPFAFRCGYCAEFEHSIKKGFYNVIAHTLGGIPFLTQKTREEDYYLGPVDDILTLKELVFTPKHHSSINLVKGGYLCDHCFECYTEN